MNIEHGEEEIVITPWPTVISIARRSPECFVALTELIDNSLDAKASHIEVSWRNDREFVISDNGVGVPDFRKLVEFGGHLAHSGDGSGIYGVGLKDAALMIGREHSTVLVESSYNGRSTKAEIRWDRAKSGKRIMAWTRQPATGRAGTEIVIRPCKIRFPHGEKLDALIDRLGYTYSPAIRRGVHIDIEASGNRHRLPIWLLPDDMNDVVEGSIVLGDRLATLRAGMLPDTVKNKRQGLTYQYKDRVVIKSGRWGCGDRDIRRISGIVELHGDWTRGRNKTELFDADDLYDEVYKLMDPLLQKAEKAAHSITLKSQRIEIESILTELLYHRGGGGGHSPNPRPKPTGPKPLAVHPKPCPDGKPRPSPEVTLRFDKGWTKEEPEGMWEKTSQATTITLYEDHPMVAKAMDPWNKIALIHIVMSIAAVHNEGEAATASHGWLDGEQALLRLARYTSHPDIRLDGNSMSDAAE